MSSYITKKVLAGGGTFTFDLQAPPGNPNVQVSFGRATGSVTVRARAHGGTRWLTISGGTFDLTSLDAGRFKLDAAALEIVDAGSGELAVTVIQSSGE